MDHNKPPTISAFHVDDQLEVTWQDGTNTSYSFLWLRDNARDAESFDQRSHQREIYTAGIPENIQPENVSLIDRGVGLSIIWPGIQDDVIYDSVFLFDASYTRPAKRTNASRALWGSELEEIRLDIDSLERESPYAGASLVSALAARGFAVIQNCPTDNSSVQRLADLLGYVRETIFGGIWQFEADEAMADSAYTPKTLRPHTDGSYSHDAPGVQILLCLENKAKGGESIMIDGYHVAEQIRTASHEIYQDLATIEVEGLYQGDGVILKAQRPVLRHDDRGNLVQVTFNNYDRAPTLMPPAEMARYYRAVQWFDTCLNDNECQWQYSLQTGEALVFDNWRVLHGRHGFQGVRRMAGCYTNREDLESRFRLLGLIDR